MRVATWAIQEQKAVVAGAKAHLARPPLSKRGLAHDPGVDDMLDVVHRAFASCLAGATIHAGTAEELRTNFGGPSLVAVAQAIAASLRDHAEARKPDAAALQEDRIAISDALDVVVAAFDARAEDGIDIDVVEARPTLVHALSELAKSAPSSIEQSALVPHALLRVRSESVDGARALESAKVRVLANGGVHTHNGAPDDVIFTAMGDAPEAVSRLVRAATTLMATMGAASTSLRLALVVVRDGDLLDAHVRAAQLATAAALLVLDEEAWLHAGAGLAAVPGLVRTVDPSAAFGHDRWELSALLVRPPLLGRDDERARLTRLIIEPSANDAPILVSLHGAAGMGKTSLVRAALREAGLDDERAPVLWGAAEAIAPTPYAAAAAMLRALAGAPAAHPQSPRRIRRLLDGLASSLPDRDAAELTSLAPVVLDLLGASDDPAVDDVAIASTTNASDERSPRAIRVAVRRALLLVAQALLARSDDDGVPAVFVVPGAEAIDGPTRDALAFVAARLGGRARVLLLSSTRLKLPPAFESTFRVERIEVGGLPAATARELCGVLLDRPGDDDDLGALVEKARGSPLALIHAVRFAVEGGLLRKRDDRWDAGDVDARDIPGRLDRLLRGRVERLPVDARRLLAGCATLGLALPPAAVEFIGIRLGMPRDDVARALAFLVDTGFLVRSNARPAAPVFSDAVDDDRPLGFEHPLLRAAAYAVVDDSERARMHGIVADALLAVVPAGSHAIAASLARHKKLAARNDEARALLAIAARRSAMFDDRQGTAQLAREGLELCNDDAAAQFPFHAEIEAIRAADVRGGRAHREALKALVKCADLARDPMLHARAMLRVARFDLLTGDAALGEDAAVNAIADLTSVVDAENAASARLLAQAWRLVALARLQRRNLDGAVDALTRARSLTPTHDHRALAALAQQQAMLLLERNDPTSAVENLLVARAHRIAIADAGGEAACVDGIAECYARLGRVANALALLDSSLQIRLRIGDDAGRAHGKKAEAEALLAIGDVDACLRAADEARALAKEHGLDRVDIGAALVVARTQLATNDAIGAEATLDSIRRRAKEPSALVDVAIVGARAKMMRASSLQGPARDRAVKSALQRAQEAVAIAEEHKLLAGQVLGMVTAGEALLVDGDKNAALTYAQRAAELLEDPAAATVPIEDVLSVYARVLDETGDAEEAADVRNRAIAALDAHAKHLPPAALDRFWALPARRSLRQNAATSSATSTTSAVA